MILATWIGNQVLLTRCTDFLEKSHPTATNQTTRTSSRWAARINPESLDVDAAKDPDTDQDVIELDTDMNLLFDYL